MVSKPVSDDSIGIVGIEMFDCFIRSCMWVTVELWMPQSPERLTSLNSGHTPSIERYRPSVPHRLTERQTPGLSEDHSRLSKFDYPKFGSGVSWSEVKTVLLTSRADSVDQYVVKLYVRRDWYTLWARVDGGVSGFVHEQGFFEEIFTSEQDLWNFNTTWIRMWYESS